MSAPRRRNPPLRLALAVLLCVAARGIARGEGAPELEEGVTAVDYNDAGIAINDALKAFGKYFAIDAAPGMEKLIAEEGYRTGPVGAWARVEQPSVHGIRMWRWEPGAPVGEGRDGAVALLKAWRARFAEVDYAAFKLFLLDELARDGTAEARFRFEVIGTATDGAVLTERGLAGGTWLKINEEGDRALTDLRLIEGESVIGPGDLFAEDAARRGLLYVDEEDARFLPPSKELRHQVIRHALGGAATADVDGDGFDDLLLTGGGAAALFRNEGDGTFEDVTEKAGLAGILHASTAVFGDLDDDGDADLYVAFFYGHNRLFRNDGGGRFADVTERSGLGQDDSTSALCLLDANGDGKLDLYVGRFLDAKTRVPDMIHYSRNGEPNRLYLGNGDLTFRDVSDRSGAANDVGLTLGVAAADYDRDGDQDLYLANDFGRNVLLRNRGDGTFDDVALQTGTLAVSAGMSASFGDYDGDGWLDLYVSSIRSNQRWFSQGVNIRFYILNIVQSQRRPRLQEVFMDLRRHLGDRWTDVGNFMLGGNYLLRNRGDGTFEDVSLKAGSRPQGWYWSSGFFDFDNDGDLDVYATNGWITNPSTEDL